MPLLYDYCEQERGSSKRRRLSSGPQMARRSWEEEDVQSGREVRHGSEVLDTCENQRDDQAISKSPTIVTSDREELIQCIKRGERPTWISKPTGDTGFDNLDVDGSQAASTGDCSEDANSGAAQSGIDLSPRQAPGPTKDPIERPPSAFHAGDFREHRDPILPRKENPQLGDIGESFNTSPPWTWQTTAPNSVYESGFDYRRTPPKDLGRARAPSLGSSLSSSYVLRAPTSPLVHATSSLSMDFSSLTAPNLRSHSPDKASRRRTLPTEAFKGLNEGSPINFSRPLPTPKPRREFSLPSQTHQSRRSLSSFTYQPLSNLHSPPFLRSRRTSFAGDASPVQHAAMVGSFEESILRGRMSTAPSRPLDFVSQIGVLGKGNCKASLKCPAHVTVPFPAVFYNYPSISARRSLADDSPSPYVGTIDLQHNLKPPPPTVPRKRPQREDKDPEQLMDEIAAPENTVIGRALARDAREAERQSPSKVSVGGCYRVPEQGQLQLVIKNPNKTAVKLFLVPYDLEGMRPGTKTFVRQRSFSLGPILEEPLTSGPIALVDPLKDKQVLRYLIHLKFCCLAKGRFYLYDNIRVVFANRVPDGKEKLRNEIQIPEPKYSPYKPSLEPNGSKIVSERDLRRRSSGFGIANELRDALEGITLTPPDAVTGIPPLPRGPIPIHFPVGTKVITANGDSDQVNHDLFLIHPTKVLGPPVGPENDTGRAEGQAAQGSGQAGVFNPTMFAVPFTLGPTIPTHRSYSPAPPEVGNGLLSKKLREYKGPVPGGNGEHRPVTERST